MVGGAGLKRRPQDTAPAQSPIVALSGEMNSKVVNAADQMLSTTSQLKS